MRLLVPDWQALWHRCPNATAFQSPNWILSWAENFNPSNLLLIQVRTADHLVGLFPLLIYQRGSERVLAFMAGGVSDYLEALVDPQYEYEVLTCFSTYLRTQSAQWDTVELTDLPPTSALLRFRNDEFCPEAYPHDVCPVLALPPGTRDLRAVLPSKKFANLRNVRNRMSRAGPSRLAVASMETVLPMMEGIFQLNTTRWAELGQSGLFREPEMRRFHLQVARPLLAMNVLRLYGLFVDDRLISAAYTFFERSSVALYIQSFDPGYASLAPGTQLVARVIEDAIQSGKTAVNFLRGREPYKYLWGACDTPTFRIQLRNPRLEPSRPYSNLQERLLT
jgi:CelD/BcsL family acetyltransferase involved in cellulose biosynthesis